MGIALCSRPNNSARTLVSVVGSRISEAGGGGSCGQLTGCGARLPALVQPEIAAAQISDDTISLGLGICSLRLVLLRYLVETLRACALVCNLSAQTVDLALCSSCALLCPSGTGSSGIGRPAKPQQPGDRQRQQNQQHAGNHGTSGGMTAPICRIADSSTMTRNRNL